MAVWAFFSFYQSLVLYNFAVAASSSSLNSSGKMIGLWDVSTMTFTCVVVTVNLRLLMACNSITRWHHISIAGSILAWFVFIFVYSGVMTSYDRQVSRHKHLFVYDSSFWPYAWCFTRVFCMLMQENIFFVIYVLMSTFYFYLSLLLIPIVALLGDFVYLGWDSKEGAWFLFHRIFFFCIMIY